MFLSFGIGLLFKGRFRNILYSDIKALMLPVCAALLQMGANVLCTQVFARDPLFGIMLTLSYILNIIFVVINYRFILFAIFGGAGLLCNFAVISLNDFYMPIRFSVWEKMAYMQIPENKLAAYTIESSETKLPFLGDIIYFPIKYFAGYASIGDILLCIGIFCLIIMMLRAKPKIRG